MDLKNIHTFLRVAELGSITKAAEEQGYVQSTVTSQIQQLEKELGFPLFDRIGKRIAITAPGREFCGYANEILHIVEKVSTMGCDPGELKGTLRIGVLESLLFSRLIHVLPLFKQIYQKIDVQVEMGRASELLVRLKQNQVDILYLSGNLNVDPDLCCDYKRQEELIFVTAPTHPAAKCEGISVRALLEYDFLLTERSGVCYQRLTELAATQQLTLRHALEVDSTVVIAELLMKNMGVAFLPKYSVEKHLQRGELVEVRTLAEPQMYYSQILHHKDKWCTPFMERFVELVGQHCPADLRTDAGC